MVDRHERLLDIYSRLLILKVRGDVGRLAAIEREARRRLEEASGDTRADPQPELVAEALAQAAERIIRDAGADGDPQARRRLLAATDYQASRDVFGVFLGDPSLAGPPDDLIAELDSIDRGEEDASS